MVLGETMRAQQLVAGNILNLPVGGSADNILSSTIVIFRRKYSVFSVC
jgi:hypothetical protein